ncbi:transposase [Caballeronia sp. LZ003]|uniref:IS66 family transposase n=1 Tax=unclassified Caballeronia TaxID=2646786 RepID=UPI0038576D8A
MVGTACSRGHQAPRMHVDDTTLPLLEKGRKTTRTARLWGYLGAGRREENGVWGDHPPAVVFEFAESRGLASPGLPENLLGLLVGRRIQRARGPL